MPTKQCRPPAPRRRSSGAERVHFDKVEDLRAATQAHCEELVKRAFKLTWSKETAASFRSALSEEAPTLLDELAGVIRRIRVLAARGAWLYAGDEIVFRVRPPGPPDPCAVGDGFVGLSGPADPKAHEQRLVARSAAAARRAPLRILIDKEPAEGPCVLRISPSARGLPSTSVLRTRLAAFLGHTHTHKNIAALSLLLQTPAFFRDALRAGHTRPFDLLDKERRAIQSACHALDINRGKEDRKRPPLKRRKES
ncbi:MAG: hypothetical protein IT377_01405 [Polyangiaceae bacterium]|nr:hypothetical protein [Polyangiaceae bacterium]